jgi:hypothetical protein
MKRLCCAVKRSTLLHEIGFEQFQAVVQRSMRIIDAVDCMGRRSR